MPNHSERQALLLRRMGIDIWKQRSSAQSAVDTDSIGTTAPVSSQPQPKLPKVPAEMINRPEEAELPEPVMKKPRVEKPQEDSETGDLQVASPTQSTKTSGSPEKLHQESHSAVIEPGPAVDQTEVEPVAVRGTIVNWRTLVEYQPDTDWLFVCAVETDLAAAEKRLFEAILFSLKLDSTTCSKIWACPVSEVEQQRVDKHGEQEAYKYISETLKEQLGKEQPDNIVLFGEQLAQFVIGTDKAIDQLRNEDYRYQGGSSRLIVTYDLGHLLENPADKAKAWGDLQKARTPK